MQLPKFKSAFVSLLTAGLLCCPGSALAQSSAPVPASYTKEYAALNNAVDTFITSLDSRKKISGSTCFGSGLDMARAGRGLTLLQPQAMQNVQTELARFKQLGIQGVTLDIGFPILCQQFYAANGDPGDWSQMLGFYHNVVQLCHAQGFTVLVESHPVSANGDGFSSIAAPFVQGLDQANFVSDMAQSNALIAGGVRPDMISVVDEPDSDYAWTKQKLYRSPQDLASFVATMVSSIRMSAAPGQPAVGVAAGADNWMSRAKEFDQALYGVSGLTAIDIHTYFAGANELEVTTALADGAHAAGLQVVSSETWLTKAGKGIPPASPIQGQAIAARAINSFSFWQPLDEEYMSAFKKWCSVENPQYFCFYYPQLLFAYLDYSQVGSLSDQQIVQLETQAQTQNMNADQFSPIGLYYEKLLSQ